MIGRDAIKLDGQDKEIYMIRIAEAHLENISPYSPSKYYSVPKVGNETNSAYEDRTWRERIHYDDNNQIYIPPMALKNTLQGAASFLGRKVPGRGMKTFAAFFKATVLVQDAMDLGIDKDSVPSNKLFVPSDGKPGGSSRVMKIFARVDKWKGVARYYIADETISKTVFEEHLKTAGAFVGLGMFRPERGGFYGRFKVNKIDWSEVSDF